MNLLLDDILPYNYRFDPEVEDMVYGDELKDGDIVLVETQYRENEDLQLYSTHGERLTKNRWCEVTKLRSDDREDRVSMIYFIGLYADGQKAVRSTTPNTGWLVKKKHV